MTDQLPLWTFRDSPEHMAAFDLACRRKGWSRSEALRKLMDKMIELEEGQ